MLKQRIITAIILVSLVLMALFNLSTEYLTWIFAGIVLLAANEVAVMCGLTSLLSRAAYLLLMLAMIVTLVAKPFSTDEQWYFFALVSAYWFFRLFYLSALSSIDSSPQRKIAALIFAFVLLIGTWMALVTLHTYGGVAWVLFLFVIIWGADSSAYFSGKRFGKVKLAPIVSPGKTREGAYGALAFSLLCGISLPYILDLKGHALAFVVLCVLTAIISIVGDLQESLWKRRAGMKDSGKLLPGHGGVMDRIDSLIAAAPVFLFGMMLIEQLP